MKFVQALRLLGDKLLERVGKGFAFFARRKEANSGRQWELDLGDTAAFHRVLAQGHPAPELVDDRTWSDLEMEKVFARLDRSFTPLGAQYLYALLRSYQEPPVLQENGRAHAAFAASRETGDRLRKALAPLNSSAAAGLAEVLFGPALALPRRHRLFQVIAVAAVVCPFGLFFSAWFLWPSLALWGASIFLHSRHSPTIGGHAPALNSLATLLGCVPAIVRATRGLELPEPKELAGQAGFAKRTRKQISWAFHGRQQGNDLVMILMEYLNVLCLFELNAACRAIAAVNEHQPALAGIFRMVARLDALQGLSVSFARFPQVCVPELKSGRSFSLAGVYHPLLQAPVANSICGAGNSLLLSGTNMSGKTTFMKAVAINLLLAQTVGLCLAEQASLPPVRIKTLIEREDRIGGGRSYFYAEACELLRMIQEAESSGRECWFVLDELFRGTNAIERIAASNAVLRYLASRWLVTASTHDQDLMDQLKADFASYHFAEVIADGAVRFDYRLRPGPCDSRNAIKLLVAAGFPREVTDLAEKLVG